LKQANDEYFDMLYAKEVLFSEARLACSKGDLVLLYCYEYRSTWPKAARSFATPQLDLPTNSIHASMRAPVWRLLYPPFPRKPTARVF
jgi:hypothetical protein